jgi:hypothetical protein
MEKANTFRVFPVATKDHHLFPSFYSHPVGGEKIHAKPPQNSAFHINREGELDALTPDKHLFPAFFSRNREKGQSQCV